MDEPDSSNDFKKNASKALGLVIAVDSDDSNLQTPILSLPKKKAFSIGSLTAQMTEAHNNSASPFELISPVIKEIGTFETFEPFHASEDENSSSR